MGNASLSRPSLKGYIRPDKAQITAPGHSTAEVDESGSHLEQLFIDMR